MTEPQATDDLTALTQTELVLPKHTNHYGTLFAPEALAMLGRTAYLAAARYSRQSVVMASSRHVDFIAPVPVGALLRLHARIVRAGRSSMTVDVRAELEAPQPGTAAREVLRSSFEMVAVGPTGRPTRLECRGDTPSPAMHVAPAH